MRPFELFLYAAVVFGWSTSWYPLSLQLGVVLLFGNGAQQTALQSRLPGPAGLHGAPCVLSSDLLVGRGLRIVTAHDLAQRILLCVNLGRTFAHRCR